VAISDGKFRN
jgi:hypothetical protein